MKPVLSFSVLVLYSLFAVSFARESRHKLKKRVGDSNLSFVEADSIPITIVEEDNTISRTSWILPNANTDDGGEPQTIVTEAGEEEANESEEDAEPNITTGEPESDSTDAPIPLASNQDPEKSPFPSKSDSKSPAATSKKQKSKSISTSTRNPHAPSTLTTQIFYKKLVKLHIHTLPATNYPTKPTSQPTFALYEEGIIYIKGIPYAILGADSEYNKVKLSDDGNNWDMVDGDKSKDNNDGKNKEKSEAVNKAEEEHTQQLLKIASGKAVYSADMVSAAENAVRKLVFFTVIGAGMIAIGLLVFFQVIGPHG
ncbi:hypothetical protein TWF694_006949 [Orbilia ellipsospora]|uniref:Uncharacterized protein n=1 Tax=Orbilia ellipsospora TaxID=2528407 RepID=A0AAV9XM49_9PEZI